MHRILSLIYLGIFCTLSHTTFALDPNKAVTQYMQQNWQHKDGLPQNTVTAIAQTPDGYLWLGTLEGLVRFDGVRFTTFNTQNSLALPDNLVVTLTVDKLGRLWIGTTGGGLVRLETDGSFTAIKFVDGLAHDQISVIYEDNQSRIWVGTDGNGLFYLENDQLTNQNLPSLLGNNIHAIESASDSLWVGSELGLRSLRKDNTAVSLNTRNGLLNNNVRAIFHDANDSLWVGTDHGLQRLPKVSELSRRAEHQPELHVESFDDAKNYSVIAIKADSHGNLWFATDGNGLIRRSNNQFTNLTSQDGLADNSILTVFEDREKNLWLGTNLGGLMRLKDGRLTTFTQSEGLSSNVIRSVYQDSQNTIWVGSEGGGVNQFQHGHFTPLTNYPDLNDSKILSILEDSQGALWFGTENGLIRIKDNHSTTYTTETGLSSNIILALLEDDQNNLWIGTYAGGLNKLSNGELTHFTTKNGLSNNTVNVILQDIEGHLWIGTRGGGLNKLSHGKFTHLTTRDGLSDDMVFALYQDKLGSLWVGTYGGGLNRLRNNSISVITEKHGLFDNVIHRIIDDGRGNFWMTSNRGIFSVEKKQLDAVAQGLQDSLKSNSFGITDGMKNAECNGGANSGILDSNNRLWFPTVEGIVQIQTQNLINNRTTAPVIIENVMIDGVQINMSDVLTIPADTKAIEVQYTATNLTSPNATQFKYQLQGLDDNWTLVNRRTAYFSQLPAGDYIFRVTAKNGDGQWNPYGDTIQLIVEPRFYETLPFMVAAGLLLLGIGFLLQRYRISRLTRRTLMLEKIVAARTEELEVANKQLAKLANEDGLTGIFNRRVFDQTLDEECRRADRNQSCVSLLLIDIDFFKHYNDALGHQAGDQCIRQVSEVLSAACVRAGDTVCRYGGDELAIILPGISIKDAGKHAEKLRQAITNLALSHPSSSVNSIVTLSIGVACSQPVLSLSASELIKSADRALYLAKQRGRNQVASDVLV